MKKLFNNFLRIIIPFIIWYSLFAFINLELDPTLWTEGERGVSLSFAIVFSFLLLAAYDRKQSDDNY